jgi:hypothetical protein
MPALLKSYRFWPAKHLEVQMKRLWTFVYIFLFVICLLGGSGMGLFGAKYPRTNVDWYLIAICFVGFFIFPFLAIGHARTRTTKLLPRPSFSRGFTGGWWVDPLQCLRLSILLLCGSLLGSLFAVLHADAQGVMTVFLKAAMLLGLVAGDLAARGKFRDSIT